MNGQSGLLLDTAVLADIRSPEPSTALQEFLRCRSSLRIFISALTLGDLRRPDRVWLQELTGRFGCHILPVDPAVALASTGLDHDAGTLTVLVAATALHHDLTVVTDRPEDFRGLGAAAVDPWEVGRQPAFSP
ncbi:hypothetical protein QMA10_02955 [Arthrobacter sp. APC 3897]|uniref:hypothetical protein n=1 Tax=Arthrobacter sp. APC 3897 TaxID=3035204 RepID=UPI0025B2E19A|nr:hypothetical protein [Arthrobacter sp. APC 3897]MDN3480883.1 hypothetical protein [Arthrobacter sp. APC 3897]